MKYILITGVSSGLGNHAARKFAEHGWQVIGTVRRTEDAAELSSAYPMNFHTVQLDITSQSSVQGCVASVERILQGAILDVLVNNAGVAIAGPLMHVPPTEISYQLEVNVVGQIRVTQALLPLMGASRSFTGVPGRIINIGSVSGLFTFPFLGPYCISKHGLEAATTAMRRELSIYGIPVTIINAATIRSEIWDKVRAQDLYVDNTDYAALGDIAPKLINASEERSMEGSRFTDLLWKVANARKPRRRYLLTANNWLYRILLATPEYLIDKAIKVRIDRMLEKKTTS